MYHVFYISRIAVILYAAGLLTSCGLKRGISYPASLVLLDKKEGLFLDYRPISNLDWREYMYYQKNKFGENSSEYLHTWPDTIAWKSVYPEETFGQTLMKYSNSPIVGISHGQALAYCRWRTEVVNQKFALKFTFELPSYEHFLYILEKKKFTTLNEMPFVRKPPANTFFNVCGPTPEYTNDSSVIVTKSNHVGQCILIESARTEYTIISFRCVARRNKHSPSRKNITE